VELSTLPGALAPASETETSTMATQAPYRVICPDCGPVLLTKEEYNRQLDSADAPWTCPKCGRTDLVFFDNAYAEQVDDYIGSEYYAFGPEEEPTIHIFRGGHEEFSVWLNPTSVPEDGLCIGQGKTRNDAVAEAVTALEWALEMLQGPAPADLAAMGGPDGVR
jgi:predicted RNA-binding Zn-ribbon protein involved in translation (DUF1610 family)